MKAARNTGPPGSLGSPEPPEARTRHFLVSLLVVLSILIGTAHGQVTGVISKYEGSTPSRVLTLSCLKSVTRYGKEHKSIQSNCRKNSE